MPKERSLLNTEPVAENRGKKTGGGEVKFDDAWFRPFKAVRIAVSGDVELNKFETSIVDTREFQRLRGIKQLGATYLVYPTAVHTRFDHSLGTFAMAVRMIEYIRNNKYNTGDERAIEGKEAQLIRIYALLHDIVHIPFGHTLEDEFNIFLRHDSDEERIGHFLDAGNTIGDKVLNVLGKDFYNRLMALHKADEKNLDELGDDLFIYDIVNNTVCADLLDYLQRDFHFCGIAWGMDYRFLKFLYLGKYDGKGRRLLIRLWRGEKKWPKRDIITELIRLLDNRYLIAERVYYHHAKLISDAMIASAVMRAKKTSEWKKENMNKKIWEIGDETFLDFLEDSRDPSVKTLIGAIRARQLWKEAYRLSRAGVDLFQSEDFDVKAMDIVQETFREDPNRRIELENKVASAAGITPGDFIISCPAPDMSSKPAEMKFRWKGQSRLLKDCVDDPVIKAKLDGIEKAHESLWEMRFYYNPSCDVSKDVIKSTCEGVLPLVSSPAAIRNHAERQVDSLAGEMGYLEDLPVKEYLLKRKEVMKRWESVSEGKADAQTLRRIMKEKFEGDTSE